MNNSLTNSYFDPIEQVQVNDGIQRSKRDEFLVLDEKSNIDQKYILRRGDGLSDFLTVKSHFYKLKTAQLEDSFYKQNVLMRGNELITTASLQNYLDTMQLHLDAQMDMRILKINEELEAKLSHFTGEMIMALKEKASKKSMQTDNLFVMDIVRDNEMKINQALASLDQIVIQKVSCKAEIKDVESLDINKADISAVKEINERINRIEMMMHEYLSADSNEDEFDERDGSFDDDVDSAEMKDQVNNSSSQFGFRHNKSLDIDDEQKVDLSMVDISPKDHALMGHDQINSVQTPSTHANVQNIDLIIGRNGDPPINSIEVINNQKKALEQYVNDQIPATNQFKKKEKENNQGKKQNHQQANQPIRKSPREKLPNFPQPVVQPSTNNKSKFASSTNQHLNFPNYHHDNAQKSPFLSPKETSPKSKVNEMKGIDLFNNKGANINNDTNAASILNDKNITDRIQDRQLLDKKYTQEMAQPQIMPQIGVKIKLSGKQVKVEENSKSNLEKEISEKSNTLEQAKDKVPLNNDMLSQGSSLRFAQSRLGSTSPYRKNKMNALKRGQPQINDTVEIDNLKRDFIMVNQQIKDLQEKLHKHEVDIHPQIAFIHNNHQKIQQVIKSYETLKLRIHEHETYDEKLKESYLKKSVETIKKMKIGIEKDQQLVKEQYQQDKEFYKQKLKTFETNEENLRQLMELVKKKLQALKFQNLNLSAQEQQTLFGSIQEGQMSTRSNFNNTQNITIIGGQVNSTTISNEEFNREIENLKNFVMIKLQEVLGEIEEIKRPVNDSIQNIQKESQALSRELDRYDALYRIILSDFQQILDDHKSLIEKQHNQLIQQQKQHQENLAYQTLPIQTHQLIPNTPLHQTKLCSLMSHPDPKSLGHHTPNTYADSILSKLDQVNSKIIDAKRRFKKSFDQDLLEMASVDNISSNNNTKLGFRNQSSSVMRNSIQGNKDSFTKTDRARTSMGQNKSYKDRDASNLIREYEQRKQNDYFEVGGGQAPKRNIYSSSMEKYKRVIQTSALHKSTGFQQRPINMTANNSPTIRSNLNDSVLTTQIVTPSLKLKDYQKGPLNEIKINLKRFGHLIQ
ncbi:UNKNOWN [Stylonychia lemnae]|uniref:Uncharacterized protein n=1 Tax=Stylonychia lemnae TaxID=5949 RepID=A0A078ADX9_STYLE|nr:UNKNOWN [Stylonychia lemnae]|eukprot:CDW80056.1 UNKNOWN [Stylonychia lemnae]